MVLIAIVGDRSAENPTHRATDAALAALGVEAHWLPTLALRDDLAPLGSATGVLVAPGSPYASMEGALAAIRWAREQAIPTLGTCGGFQHMLIEFARNVAGIAGAEHAESHPDAATLVVTPLACSLVGQQQSVHVAPVTLAADLYGTSDVVEPFFCSYGLNPAYWALVEQAGLRFSGAGPDGEPRILELPDHPFFLGTLYVPQAGTRRAGPHPLLAGLVTAADQVRVS